MTRDRLEERARHLFEAARNEGPSDALHARILSRSHASTSAARRSDDDRDAVGAARPALVVPEWADESPHRLRAGRVVTWVVAAGALAASMIALLRARHDAPAPIFREEPAPVAEVEPHAPPADSARDPVPVATTMAPVVSAPPRDKTIRPTPRNEAVAPPSPAPHVAVDDAPSPSAAPSARPTLAQELEWLKRVRAMLRSGNSQGALSLLDAYTSDLRGSDLSAEATVLRIEALAAAGRAEEASALAKRFVGDNPNSPLVDRARSFLRAP